MSFSDSPSAARDGPVVGANTELDLERIAATHPDLIIVWWHGNQDRQIERFKTLRIPLSGQVPPPPIARDLHAGGKLQQPGQIARTTVHNVAPLEQRRLRQRLGQHLRNARQMADA